MQWPICVVPGKRWQGHLCPLNLTWLNSGCFGKPARYQHLRWTPLCTYPADTGPAQLKFRWRCMFPGILRNLLPPSDCLYWRLHLPVPADIIPATLLPTDNLRPNATWPLLCSHSATDCKPKLVSSSLPENWTFSPYQTVLELEAPNTASWWPSWSSTNEWVSDLAVAGLLKFFPLVTLFSSEKFLHDLVYIDIKIGTERQHSVIMNHKNVWF